MNISQYKAATKQLEDFQFWSFKVRHGRGHLKPGEFLLSVRDMFSAMVNELQRRIAAIKPRKSKNKRGPMKGGYRWPRH